MVWMVGGYVRSEGGGYGVKVVVNEVRRMLMW